jgi:TonB family protein
MQRWVVLVVGYVLLVVGLSPLATPAEHTSQAETDLQAKYTNALQEIERLQRELAEAKQEIEHLRQQLDRTHASRSTDQSPGEQTSAEEKTYTEALVALTQTIENNPQDAMTYRNRGIVHERLGNYQQAMQDFNTAIEFNLQDPVVYNQRGIIHFRLGNYPQAVEDFSQAIAYNPKLAESYNNRGLLYRKLGNYGQAIKDLQRAAALGLEVAAQYLQIVREEVRQAQEYLQQAGFAPGPADGMPGTQTVAALRAYQKREHLPVTGLLDDRTKTALGIRLDTPSTPHQPQTEASPFHFLQQPKPAYPLLARQQGWEGTVTLRFEMLADGTIGKVDVVKSSGYSILDTAAQDAVTQWTHEPAKRHGMPVTRWGTLDFNFTLDKVGKQDQAP